MPTRHSTRHSTRQIRVWRVASTPTRGRHLTLVTTGTWAECLRHLRATARHQGTSQFFYDNGTIDHHLTPLI